MTVLDFPDSPSLSAEYYAPNGVVYVYVGNSIWNIKDSTTKQLSQAETEPTSAYDYWLSPIKGRMQVYNSETNTWEYLVNSSDVTKFDNVEIDLINPTFNTSEFTDYDYTKYYKDIFEQETSTDLWEMTHGLNTESVTITITDSNGDEVSSDDYEVEIVNEKRIDITFDYEVSGQALIVPTDPYPQQYSMDSSILSTHYKVEYNLSTNPFADSYIITKEVVNDLYNKWEEFRPITRVSHYSQKFDILTDITGDEIPLYSNPIFDANLYTKSVIESNTCNNAYIYHKTTAGTTWNVSHDLNTKNVIVQTFKMLSDGSLEEIIPTDIQIVNNNYISATFGSSYTGYMFILKADYWENQDHASTEDLTWNIWHGLDDVDILYEAYDINNKKVVPKSFEIVDSNSAKIVFSQVSPGKCLIKSTKDETNYVHTQSTLNTTWTVSHNLGTKNILFEIYDENNVVISPLSAVRTNTNTLTLTFSQSVKGKCVVLNTTSEGYSHTQSVNSADWYIQHNLDTEHLFFKAYDINDNLIYPKYTENTSDNVLHLVFNTAIKGSCIVLDNPDEIYYNQWIVNHDFDQKYNLAQVYTEIGGINYKVDTDNINIIDEDNLQIDISDVLGIANLATYIPGAPKCEIGNGYLYTKSVAGTTWSIPHNLDNFCIVLDVYDTNDEIVPHSDYKVVLNSKNGCTLTFDTATAGKCVIRSIGNAFANIIASLSAGYTISLKSDGISTDALTYEFTESSVTSVSTYSDRMEIGFQIPKGISGYFNEIEIYNNEGILCFETTGDPIYKHSDIKVDINYVIKYESIN